MCGCRGMLRDAEGCWGMLRDGHRRALCKHTPWPTLSGAPRNPLGQWGPLKTWGWHTKIKATIQFKGFHFAVVECRLLENNINIIIKELTLIYLFLDVIKWRHVVALSRSAVCVTAAQPFSIYVTVGGFQITLKSIRINIMQTQCLTSI